MLACGDYVLFFTVVMAVLSVIQPCFMFVAAFCCSGYAGLLGYQGFVCPSRAGMRYRRGEC